MIVTENVSFMERAIKTRMGKYLNDVELAFIAKSVDFSRFKLVLDVGAESGQLSFLVIDNKTDVVNIDIDRGSLIRCKQRLVHACVIMADARCLPFIDGVFDAAFMLEVLDYIPKLDIPLSECSRVLKAGSDCVLTFGNKSSFKGKVKGLKGNSYLHSYDGAVQDLSKVGFCLGAQLGFNWLPFGRTSQNRLIPLFVWFERFLGLRSLRKYSPWILFHVVKQSIST